MVAASSAIDEFVRDQVRDPATFLAEIHPEDEMLLHALPLVGNDPSAGQRHDSRRDRSDPAACCAPDVHRNNLRSAVISVNPP
jgi:hypothetical protein